MDMNKTATEVMLEEEQKSPYRLVVDLVGSEYRDQYLSNAWFKGAIDELARFLPFVVAGLAAKADENLQEMGRLRNALIDGQPIKPI